METLKAALGPVETPTCSAVSPPLFRDRGRGNISASGFVNPKMLWNFRRNMMKKLKINTARCSRRFVDEVQFLNDPGC